MDMEAKMRQALEGQFTYYVGRPYESIEMEDIWKKRKEERAKQDAIREAAKVEQARQAAERAMREALSPPRKIIAAVSKAHGIHMAQIIGPSRDYKITAARHHAVWEVLTRLDYGLTRTGRIFARDHSTISNSREWFSTNRHLHEDKVQAVAQMLTTNEVKE